MGASPDPTSARRYHLILSVGLLAVAVAMALAPLLADVDRTGVGIFIFMIVFVLALAAWNFRRFRRSSPGDAVYLPHQAPPGLQRAFYRRMIWLSLAAFPVLTWSTVEDLNALERGAAESVEVFVTAAWLYGALGYWPAVLSVPIVGVACIGVFVWKTRQAARAERAGSAGLGDRAKEAGGDTSRQSNGPNAS